MMQKSLAVETSFITLNTRLRKAVILSLNTVRSRLMTTGL